jgi:tellurite resistance protein TerC
MITPTSWIITVGVVVALLALDLAITGRRGERGRTGSVSLRAATAWSLGYVAIALAFGAALGLLSGWELGGEYLAGYVVEKSLSIDNLFVFVAIFGAFAIPDAQRPRLLAGGIVAALVLRVAFIAAGAALLHAFSWSFAIFGAILLVAAVHLLRHSGQTPRVADNRFVRALRDRGVSGARLALVTMIGADLLFALDSIPAVYGVTEHPFVVFAANAFALLGLRALFFLVAGLVRTLVHLPLGMAAILAFIGVKLILHAVHEQGVDVPTISTGLSLAVIVTILALTTLTSLVAARRRRSGPLDAREHLAGDDELLDLGGPLVDPVQPGVAVEALDRDAAHVAEPAEDLDAAVGDPPEHLRAEQLRRGRALARVGPGVERLAGLEGERAPGPGLGL